MRLHLASSARIQGGGHAASASNIVEGSVHPFFTASTPWKLHNYMRQLFSIGVTAPLCAIAAQPGTRLRGRPPTCRQSSAAAGILIPAVTRAEVPQLVNMSSASARSMWLKVCSESPSLMVVPGLTMAASGACLIVKPAGILWVCRITGERPLSSRIVP